MAQPLTASRAWTVPLDVVKPFPLGRLVRASLARLDEALCGVRGHETVRSAEGDKLTLRCIKCGHTTAGWTVGPAARASLRRDAVKQTHETGRPVKLAPMSRTWCGHRDE